jgi:hypothetical protein
MLKPIKVRLYLDKFDFTKFCIIFAIVKPKTFIPMGCFNYTCQLSGLILPEGTTVYFLPLVVETDHGGCAIYANFLPLTGTLGAYGNLQTVEENYNYELFKEKFGCDVFEYQKKTRHYALISKEIYDNLLSDDSLYDSKNFEKYYGYPIRNKEHFLKIIQEGLDICNMQPSINGNLKAMTIFVSLRNWSTDLLEFNFLKFFKQERFYNDITFNSLAEFYVMLNLLNNLQKEFYLYDCGTQNSNWFVMSKLNGYVNSFIDKNKPL